jgi:hypothetical protein
MNEVVELQKQSVENFNIKIENVKRENAKIKMDKDSEEHALKQL